MRLARLAVLGVAALGAACGGGDGGGSRVLVNGAGATFPNLIYQKWMIDYNGAQDGAEFNYQSIGSGGGVRQFSDGTVDFGASDAPMTDEEIEAAGGNVLHIPTVLGAVVPTYNLEAGAEPLNFSPDVLAGIFLGDITQWDDARIASINPGRDLPDVQIVVVHRSDGSGTSFIWTEYLSKVSGRWAAEVGAGKSVSWPTGLGAKGNEGVTATVQQTPGAIGYVELGYALLNGLPAGNVQNRTGNFIRPSIESVSAAAAGAMASMGPDTDFRVSLTDAEGPDSYPVSSFTWLLLRREYDDADPARELARFIWWSLSEGKTAAPALGYAPLPEAMSPWIQARLQSITAAGAPVWTVP